MKSKMICPIMQKDQTVELNSGTVITSKRRIVKYLDNQLFTKLTAKFFIRLTFFNEKNLAV